ncbi:MAG: hypothetical protein ABFQ65_01890 [Nanoarchaeota archaeon]
MDEDEEFSGESVKKPKNEDLLIDAKNFFDAHKRELGDSLRDSEGVIFIDFIKYFFLNRINEKRNCCRAVIGGFLYVDGWCC